MATNYPTNLDTFVNPSATDTLATTGVVHHEQHANINDAVLALQRKVGVDSSADTASLDYLFTHLGNTYLQRSSNLSDLTNVGTARTNLGLGALALLNSLTAGDIPDLSAVYDVAGLASAALSAAISLSAQRASNLSDLVSASSARSNLGLGTLATQSGTFSGTSSGTNTGDQTSIVGITGTLTEFNTALTGADFATGGGTATGSNTGDQDLSGLLVKSSNLSDLTSASTARTNLGLGTLATQSGTFSGTSSGTNTGDQTITLTGGVTGSGTGSFATTVVTNANLTGNVTSVGNATTIAAGVVTNTMLAGSITAAKLVGTDIVTVGTLTAGATGAGFTVALGTSTITGALGEMHGGTGQTAYVKGDILQASATNTLVRHAGNITTTRMFLVSAGTGSAANEPIWDTLAFGDLPDLSGTYQAVYANLNALGLYGGTGLWAITGTGTGTGRSIAVGSASLTISNGSGVAGNPTLDTAQNIQTSATPTFGGLSLAATNTATSGTQALQSMLLTASPTANSSASYRAISNQVTVSVVDGSGVGITQSGQSIGFNVISASSGTVLSGTASYSGTLQTFNTQFQHGSSSGTLGTGVCGSMSIAHLGGGTITSALGLRAGSNYLSTGNTTASRVHQITTPLVRSGVASVAVGAGGSGWTAGTTTAATSGGSGSGAVFDVTVVAGAITAVTVLHPGSSFASTPSIVFSGTGTGASATATIAKGTVTTHAAIEIQDQGNANITSCVGLMIATQTTSTNHIALLVGSTTIPSGVVGAVIIPPTTSAKGLVVQGLASRSGALLQQQTSASESLGNVGGYIWDHIADGGSTHTDGTEDTLYTDTTVANTLIANGDKVEFLYAVLTVAHATATRRIQVYFAGTAIYDSIALATATADTVVLRGVVIRESSTVVRCIVYMSQSGSIAFTTSTYTRITGLTLTASNIIKITGIAAATGAASGDITAKLGRILWGASAT